MRENIPFTLETSQSWWNPQIMKYRLRYKLQTRGNVTLLRFTQLTVNLSCMYIFFSHNLHSYLYTLLHKIQALQIRLKKIAHWIPQFSSHCSKCLNSHDFNGWNYILGSNHQRPNISWTSGKSFYKSRQYQHNTSQNTYSFGFLYAVQHLIGLACIALLQESFLIKSCKIIIMSVFKLCTLHKNTSFS